MSLQGHAEHHGSHGAEAGEVGGQLPTQVDVDEQCVGQLFAEDPMGARGSRAQQPDSQAGQSCRHTERDSAASPRLLAAQGWGSASGGAAFLPSVFLFLFVFLSVTGRRVTFQNVIVDPLLHLVWFHPMFLGAL